MDNNSSDVTLSKSSEKERMTKWDYIRIIALWGAIFALVIFTYQLGQWNAINISNKIIEYCGNVPHNVSVLGDIVIYNVTKFPVIK